MLYPVLELKDENGNKIKIESNEGAKEEPQIGITTMVSYKNDSILMNSVASILMYVGALLGALLILMGIIWFVFFKNQS